MRAGPAKAGHYEERGGPAEAEHDLSPGSNTAVATTTVEFAALTDAEIDGYVASGEPADKAGAYAIQGLASRFVTRIDGSYSNVVGLPVALVYACASGRVCWYPEGRRTKRKSFSYESQSRKNWADRASSSRWRSACCCTPRSARARSTTSTWTR